MEEEGPTEAAGLPGANAETLAVRCVRRLFERHGLPKYRQSPWLADALGLSYSQAHRRMNGTSPWTLEDLERVGAMFGEGLADVVAPERGRGFIDGRMKIGGADLDCRLWLGETIADAKPNALVAVSTAAGWTALLAGEAGDQSMYRVERLETATGTAARPVIAVLDDDEDLTNSICAHFNASGYDARPFYRTADLLARAAVERHDGFVIDWIVGETSTLALIASLRERDAASPIVVLTGQVMMGVVDEADIAAAVKTYGLAFSEKPVRMSILSATLALAFRSDAPPAVQASLP
jgi:ActR/RegA family two-component response regulator